MDTEQIRSEMRLRRASIDRKLHVLANRTASVRHEAVRRAAAAAAVTGAALIGVWWWRGNRVPQYTRNAIS